MMSLRAIPASMASRVARGRQRMAVRRSSIACRRGDIGLRTRIGVHVIGGRRGRQANSSPRKEPCMKLGVHIGYWGLGMSAQDQLAVVCEAERLGYDSVWTAEAYGSDAATVLAWLAAQTTTIRLGSGILQMPGRSAAMTAM